MQNSKRVVNVPFANGGRGTTCIPLARIKSTRAAKEVSSRLISAAKSLLMRCFCCCKRDSAVLPADATGNAPRLRIDSADVSADDMREIGGSRRVPSFVPDATDNPLRL